MKKRFAFTMFPFSSTGGLLLKETSGIEGDSFGAFEDAKWAALNILRILRFMRHPTTCFHLCLPYGACEGKCG